MGIHYSDIRLYIPKHSYTTDDTPVSSSFKNIEIDWAFLQIVG